MLKDINATDLKTFMSSFSFSVQQCKDIFGKKFTQDFIQAGINRTNTMYGGYGLKVTRVVFPNGSIDPWHALGVTKDLSKEATALYIQGNYTILLKRFILTT